jgi:hypothetical protein
MQIIDKNKDYYDYCQFEFGQVDKSATYDRRGSVLLTEDEFFKLCYGDILRYLNDHEENNKDAHWYYFKSFIKKKYLYYGWKEPEYQVLLEIGNIQYVLLFKNTRYMWIDYATSNYKIRGDISILYKFDNNVHLCNKPITLRYFRNKNEPHWKTGTPAMKSALDIGFDKIYHKNPLNIENPILKDTPIPAIIPARDIYNALDNYFRSMYNDKTVEIQNSDIDKAINHGFDKKTSFRNPVKL